MSVWRGFSHAARSSRSAAIDRAAVEQRVAVTDPPPAVAARHARVVVAADLVETPLAAAITRSRCSRADAPGCGSARGTPSGRSATRPSSSSGRWGEARARHRLVRAHDLPSFGAADAATYRPRTTGRPRRRAASPLRSRRRVGDVPTCAHADPGAGRRSGRRRGCRLVARPRLRCCHDHREHREHEACPGSRESHGAGSASQEYGFPATQSSSGRFGPSTRRAGAEARRRSRPSPRPPSASRDPVLTGGEVGPTPLSAVVTARVQRDVVERGILELRLG